MIAPALKTPAKATDMGINWNGVIAKVNCMDVGQMPDGQWQFSGDVSVGGDVRSD